VFHGRPRTARADGIENQPFGTVFHETGLGCDGLAVFGPVLRLWAN
jgi:hypothetical protein